MKVLKYILFRKSIILFYILCIIISVWPALYNNFPLVTPDSGAYVHNGVKLSLPVDRPVTYSIFILLTSWGISLWSVIAVQGLIFTFLLQRLCTKTLGINATNPLVLAIIALTTFGTQAAWFTAQLMPDAFTGLLLIAIILFFAETPDNKKPQKLLIWAVAGLMLLHYSHILICILLTLALICYCRYKKHYHHLAKAKILGIISIACYLLVASVNLIAGRGFTLSPASHVFIMSRMAENGILDAYLHDKCPTHHYELCNYQGKLGDRQWDFMWVGNYPHAQKGWLDKDVKHEYNSIIWGTLTSPKYLAMHAMKATDATFRQLTQLYIGDGLYPQTEGSSPYNTVNELFHHQIKEYRTSLQSGNQLPVGMFNAVIFTVCGIVLLMFLLVAQRHKEDFSNSYHLPIDWQAIFVIAVSFIIINAFITANFSTVIARLQARAFWVLPFLCLLYCASKCKNMIGIKNQNV